jgi:quinol monooxygenase YgiN
MRRAFPALLAAVVFGLSAGTSGQQANSTALHVVSYVEVAPGAERAATGLLRQYRDASRRDHGSLRMDVLQQIGRPDHFVVLESWQDKDAWTAHGAAAHTKQFAAELPLQLVSPVDRQLFNSLAVAAGSATDDAVYVVTHVDTIPSPQSDAPGLLKRLADDSRKDDGNLRFDVLQSDRKNHFTVVEAWRNQRALDAHTAAMHTKQYREQLQPLAGSPLDERVFTVLK